MLCLKDKLGANIAKTVDGFQGQQKEVIIMSLVRDNYSGSKFYALIRFLLSLRVLKH